MASPSIPPPSRWTWQPSSRPWPRPSPAGLARAASLYQGDLLAGLAVAEPPFEEWLLAERERLRELALEALARLLAHHRAEGRPEAAVQTAVQLAALDPLQEAVHRTLMRLYVELGRRGAALRQYQHCVTVLRRELGVEPEEETKQLYQRDPARAPDGGQLRADGPAPVGRRRRRYRCDPVFPPRTRR